MERNKGQGGKPFKGKPGMRGEKPFRSNGKVGSGRADAPKGQARGSRPAGVLKKGPSRPNERPAKTHGAGQVKHNPNALAARRVALDTLLDVSVRGAYASLALERRLAQSGLSARDRAFVTRLVYGTIENRLQLDWRIDQTLEQEKELEPIIREILRMGAYQLFRMDRVPDMAAVDESVALTRAMGMEALTGLTNAVLRNMIRKKDEVSWPSPTDDPIRHLSIVYSAPDELCRLLIDAWGERGALEVLRYRPEDRPITLRVNALRCDEKRLERMLTEEGLRWQKGVLKGTYKVSGAGDLTALRGYANGLFTIQGESSVLAARAIEAKPGQTILDACAAPGGKSAVLAEDMMDSGRVYAWDTHPHRVELIRKTAARLRLESVRPMIRDASRSRPEMDGLLDAALIDAPCSGTGVLSEKPDLKYRVTREGVEELVQTQRAILDAVAPMVRPGGLLVYSTCSILPEENEEQAGAFLQRHPEYERCPLRELLPETLRGLEGENGLQLFAHRDGMDGFFICRMRRKNRG